MNSEEMQFLGDFYRNLADSPLDPASDKRYVPLYGDVPDSLGEDPVELLARAIQWLPGESSQLLSGFRGTGKSTELRRLRDRLREAGYFVAMLDMEPYVNMSTPIDVSDFLIALAGAAGEALSGPDFLGVDETKEGYWTRLSAFLSKTKISVSDSSAGGLKVNLKSDPSGELHATGIAALRRVVASRGDVKRLFGDEALLDRVILASGGHLRDLLRLVAGVIQRARALPVDERTVTDALDNARMQMLPIPDEDAPRRTWRRWRTRRAFRRSRASSIRGWRSAVVNVRGGMMCIRW